MSHISNAFDMTADTLWVVWTHTSPVALAKGLTKDKITCHWMLASRGEEGAREIQGPRGIPKRFIAAAPLSALRQAAALLTDTSSHRPSWIKQLFSTMDGVRLFQLGNGQLKWQLSHETPPENSVLLCEGSRTDISDLLEQGERILKHKDYKLVIGDARPVSDGHPSDWIMHKRDPAGMARVDAWLNSESA